LKQTRIITLITLIVITFLFTLVELYAKKAPPIALKDLKGNWHFLSKMVKKNPVIVSFWATYCVPCKKEIKMLKEAKISIPVYYINIDKSSDLEKVKKKIKDWGIPHTILLDFYQKTIKRYTPNLVVPSTFLISKRKRVIRKIEGFSEKKLQKFIKYCKKLK